MLAKILSCAVIGVEGWLIQVEVDIARGLPVFATVGLPDNAVKESKDRVKSAIKNCGYEFPAKRITVNLAPADIRKEGAGFDLPIAIGILQGAGLFTQTVEKKYCIVGELSLDGTVQKTRGILPILIAAKKSGVDGIIIPEDNRKEAQLFAEQIEIIAVHRLQQAVEFLAGISPVIGRTVTAAPLEDNHIETEMDFEEIKGQNYAKRGLEIAAAGGHNVLLVGPPGGGKTMLAKRFPTILPDMNFEELIETTAIHSVSTKTSDTKEFSRVRPFRSPHHTISDAGLIGGGNIPQPGEVSLAHNGVLFLDELPEFRKNVLEALRQPVEDGEVTIARANMTLTYPARFSLIAAMNPCPCGFLGDRRNSCRCGENEIHRYTSRISGPLLDRIDLHIEVAALDFKELNTSSMGESSATIKQRVNEARLIQLDRFRSSNRIYCNGQMSSKQVKEFCSFDRASEIILEKSMHRLGLSARSYHRTLKMARTIADLDHSSTIRSVHVAEAIQLCRVASN